MTIRAGERREFPFRFEVPGGPVTYRGTYLNLDWYLTAHAKGGLLQHLKAEQDFLLQGCDRGPAVSRVGDEFLA